MENQYKLLQIMPAPDGTRVLIRDAEINVYVLGLFEGPDGESFVDAVFPLADYAHTSGSDISQPAKIQEGFRGLKIGDQTWKKVGEPVIPDLTTGRQFLAFF